MTRFDPKDTRVGRAIAIVVAASVFAAAVQPDTADAACSQRTHNLPTCFTC